MSSVRWVRPDQDIGGFSFDDTDVARARLIQELRHELLIDEEALPVVLSLLDQVYALRRTLRQVAAAMQDLPDTTRDDLIERLRRQHRP
jgi:chaperone modulatory protein CbpM